MASHLDLEEQEQLAELKHFWSRWGNLITWCLIVLLGAYAAWSGWGIWTSRQAAQAAVLYDSVARAADQGDLPLLERATSDIQDKFAGTTYAHQAALLTAGVLHDKGNTAGARKQLSWVIERGSDPAYQALAHLRLAGLMMEDKAFDDARKQLSAKVPEAFAPLMADRLGDLEMMQNRPNDAVAQYRKAWQGLPESAQYRRLVAVKLAALGQDPEDKAATEKQK